MTTIRVRGKGDLESLEQQVFVATFLYLNLNGNDFLQKIYGFPSKNNF